MPLKDKTAAPKTPSRRTRGRRGPGAPELTPKGSEPARSETPPHRQCMHCRASRPKPELIELTAGQVPEAPEAKTPRGRGSYVCVARACLVALAARAPASAAVGRPGLLAEVAQLGRSRFLGMLGLSRRQGTLLLGAEQVREAQQQRLKVDAYAANDVAERTLHRLRQGGPLTPLPLTAQALGRAVGCQRAAAVGIVPGRLGQRAAYWLRVWYEAEPQAPEQRTRAENIDTASGTMRGRDGRIEVAR